MTQIVARITSRKDTEANWAALATPLALAEIAFSTDAFYSGTDQMKFKVGDGVQAWSQLDYMPLGVSTTPTLQQVLTQGSVLTQNNTITGAYTLTFDINNLIGNLNGDLDISTDNGVYTTPYIYLNNSGNQWQLGNSLSYLQATGGVVDFVGTSIGILAPTLLSFNSNSVRFAQLTPSTVPYIDANKDIKSSSVTPTQLSYVDATSSIQTQLNARELLSNKGAASGYVPLDGSSKIPTIYLPAIALTDVFVVASQAAQLALTAEEGDVAVRTDQNKSYVHNGGVSGTMADWQELLTPTDSVLSVNGGTGAVTITVTGTTNRISVSGGTGLTPTIDISASYIGQSSITTLGTIGTGVWQGTSISTTYTDAKIKGSVSASSVAIVMGNGTADTVTNTANLTYTTGSNNSGGLKVINGASAVYLDEFDNTNKGSGVWALLTGTSKSASNFMIGRYDASATIINSLTTGTGGGVRFRINNGSDYIFASDTQFRTGSAVLSYFGGAASTASARVQIGGNITSPTWTTTGIQMALDAATYTDNGSAGTRATGVAVGIARPTFAASSAVTVTDAATVYIANDVAAGSNMTLTRTHALWVAAGISRFGGDVKFENNLISTVAGKGLQLQSGTNQRAGNATLVAGTVTVNNTTVTANTVVILTRKTSGGTIGTAITYTVSAGNSFTINSDNILDTSTFSYHLIEVN